MIVLVLVSIPFAALGFAAARWSVVPAAAAVWPVYFLGLERNWWGNGVGDGWEYALLAATVFATAAAAAGVAARRATTASRHRSSAA